MGWGYGRDIKWSCDHFQTVARTIRAGEMSESARTSSDAFGAAVARVVGLHQTQVYGEFVALKRARQKLSQY